MCDHHEHQARGATIIVRVGVQIPLRVKRAEKFLGVVPPPRMTF